MVTTKLAPPLAPSGHHERPRVSLSLDRALDDRVRLALVVGPPGYGKTLAVAGWLQSRQIPRAWLSLDTADNDLARFVRYFVAALRAVRPDAGDATVALFSPGTNPSLDLVGATLLEELAASDDAFVFILDDYHVIGADEVHRLVRFLVDHAPPFAHLVVLTREDPPLPIARLRAHGQLVELRANDLRFTSAEAAAFLADSIGGGLEGGDLDRLVVVPIDLVDEDRHRGLAREPGMGTTAIVGVEPTRQ